MDKLPIIEHLRTRLASILANPLSEQAQNAAKKVSKRLARLAEAARDDPFEAGIIESELHKIGNAPHANLGPGVVALPINSLVRTDATPEELRAQLAEKFRGIGRATEKIGLDLKGTSLSPASIFVWDQETVQATVAELASQMSLPPPSIANGPMVTGRLVRRNENVAIMGWLLHYPGENQPCEVAQWIMSSTLPVPEIETVSQKLVDICQRRYPDAWWQRASQKGFAIPPTP